MLLAMAAIATNVTVAWSVRLSQSLPVTLTAKNLLKPLDAMTMHFQRRHSCGPKIHCIHDLFVLKINTG